MTYAATTVLVELDLGAGIARFPTRDWSPETIRSFESAITGVGDDRLTGTSGANSLASGAGDDRLFGGAGADLLDGGDGADLLEGGSGNDTVLGNSGSDTVRGGLGVDLIDFTGVVRGMRINLDKGEVIARDGAFTQSLASVETAIGGDGDDRITGRDVADALQGGLGDDTILGGAGDDTLSGGFLDAVWDQNVTRDYPGDGDDWIRGGKGSDTLEVVNITVYMESPGEMTVNLRDGYAEVGVGESGYERDRLSSIENIIAGDTSDLLIGTDADNRIEGGDGINEIRGGHGDDTLIGGDYYWQYDQEPDVREDIYGGTGDDVIIANGFSLSEWQYRSIGDQYLSGGAGDDHIEPGLANSEIRGGSGADIFRFDTAWDEIGGSGITVATVAATAVIKDFERGDRIEIEVLSGERPAFIGEVESADQDHGQLFYQLENDGGLTSTRLRLYFASDDWDNDGVARPVGLDILLEGYAEGLGEEDFAFIL